MATPTTRNRLSADDSLYLRQHADNPVNWQPWDDRAFQTAQQHDVPVFLSIGYAACHWCHVMAEESFTDAATATQLNEQFVPIKLDREERPDIDLVYQQLCQSVTGSGGWPLSVWLTPDGRPFSIGTYYPAAKRHGRPAFQDVLTQMTTTWTEDRSQITRRASQWTDQLQTAFAPPDASTAAPITTPIRTVADAAVDAADRTHGGWGRRTKFPSPRRIETLLVAHEMAPSDDTAYRDVLTTTLTAMADGGIYDHLDGGFHRYATDRDWTVPHFEKMLYDNVELARIYALAAAVTDHDRFQQVAIETLDFIEASFLTPDGGLYSTLDARSPLPDAPDDAAVEGGFYTWTPAEIDAALSADWACDLIKQRFGVTAAGDIDGRSVLRIETSIETLATEFDRSPAVVRETLKQATHQLARHRSQRPSPQRDDKIISAWNGLGAQAFATAAAILDTPAYAARATDILSVIQDRLWDRSDRYLMRRLVGDTPAYPGVLSDYAFLGLGALATATVADSQSHRQFAVDLATAIERRFWDPDSERLYYAPETAELLPVRPVEVADRSVPASQGAAAMVLEAVDPLVDHTRFGDIATAVTTTAGPAITDRPLSHPTMALAAGGRHPGSPLINSI